MFRFSLTVLVLACIPSLVPSAAPQQFRIAGVVVDSASGAPIENAEVTIASVPQLSETSATLSGANGQFTFAGVAAGKYRITAGRTGYTQQALDQHESFSTAIAVGPKLDSEHVRFRLSREAVLSGVVSDEVGDPVRGAAVFLFQRRLSAGVGSTSEAGRTETDDLGEYRLPHLAPGTYFVVVYAKPWYGSGSHGMTSVRSDGISVDPSPDGRRMFVLDNGFETLSVASSDSQPDTASAPNPIRDVVYPVSFYPNADSFDAATPLVLSSGSAVTADFSLHPVPGLHIFVKATLAHSEDPPRDPSGKLLDAFLTTLHASLELAGVELDQFGANAVQQTPGYFEVKNVPPGEITFQSVLRAQERVDVRSTALHLSSDSSIDLTSAGSVFVSGTLDFSPRPAVKPQDGAISIQQASLHLTSSDGRSRLTASVNAQGEFSLSAPPGKYTVSLQPEQFTHVASLQATGAQASGNTLTITSGSSVKLQVHVAQATCTVSGTALKNGKPFGGAMLLLVPEDSSQDASLFHRDQSDSDGTFTMSPVLPGRYTLLALENGWDLEWSSLSVLFPYLSSGIPLDLKPSSSVSTTVKVQ